jgi:hypothetical protein
MAIDDIFKKELVYDTLRRDMVSYRSKNGIQGVIDEHTESTKSHIGNYKRFEVNILYAFEFAYISLLGFRYESQNEYNDRLAKLRRLKKI